MTNKEDFADRAYRNRLHSLIEKVGGRDKAATIMGKSVPSVDRYKKGAEMPFQAALRLCDSANVTIEWLATGRGAKISKGVAGLEDHDVQAWDNGTVYNKSPAEQKAIDEHTYDLDFVSLPVIDIPASAGGGRLFLKEDRDKWILLERLWLYNNLNMNVDTLFCMHCVGESMEPTIHSGELMIATRSEGYLKPGDGIYIARLDGHVIVKRLQLLPGNKILISSDNSNYKPYEIPLDEGMDFKILGKVVMVTGSRRV